MATQNPPVSQTKSFSTVFLIEMWERFGFYGMQVLMVTYMVKKLGFPDVDANLVWGAASALIYATPAIGGWIGDKFLGTRRTMLTGAVVLMVGYALLWIPTNNTYFLYVALGVIILGNGLFKPNAGNLVRKIYEGDEVKIDSAFTIYYMAVNVGSTISMILTPWIRDYVGEHYGDALGWHTAFGVCSIGLILGLINYFFMRRTLAHVGSAPDEHPPVAKNVLGIIGAGILIIAASSYILQNQSVAQACVYIAGVVILGIFAYLIYASETGERAGLIAALVLTIQTIFFFIFYQQMSTSLNLFAQRNVDLDFSLFGLHILTWIPEQFQSLNAIWIVVLSPILVWIYNALGRRGKDFPVAAKFALGFVAVAVGFFMYGLGATTAIAGKISSWYMVWGYGFYSLGEILVSGLGLAMIARYVPARMGGFMMGAYYVASGVAQYMGSVVANYAAIPDNITDPLESLRIYTSLFNKLGFVGVGCVAIAVAMLPLMKKLSLNHALANVPPVPPVHNEDL
ncbi:MAG: oligopeptide:H+ symporter [Luteibacter sp.]|uniref:peptide MFS transporter n=1 Tax=Luteibacter TaxID=242605 RepID=UPI00055C743A|nr:MULTISPECIES: oligopeptide:H+ symporter [unclassified Luteibacter]MDQ7996196.1 oligopeptide:H+ symporter [Luteibacter sp.]MDQ8051119.1 oligopeptide:H+ symporter [Luteibacter sp.]MDR6643871.1 POT family proton-dependent oligopeptide transporter [Luteibacter sp. 1214]